MRSRLLLASLLLLLPLVAAAEDGGGVEDAGPPIEWPDGSVGEGGADREQQEGQDSTGRVPSTCRRSIECPRAFQCVEGRCRYTGIREADGGFGCGGALTGTSLPAGMFVAWLHRRRRRS